MVISLFRILKKSFLQSITSADITPQEIFLVLAIATVLSLYIYFIYRVLTRKTFYNKTFNISLAALALITAGIILTIQSSIVVSLGMVGALSIVRFRTAIKDSRDTVYIFWTIIVGICCGVGDFIVAGIGSGFVFIILLVLGAIKNNNRMLVIIRGARTKESQIQAVMYKFFGAKAVLRVKNSTDTSIEFIYEITANMLQKAERKNNIGICDEIYKIGNIEYVNTVMQNDEISN